MEKEQYRFSNFLQHSEEVIYWNISVLFSLLSDMLVNDYIRRVDWADLLDTIRQQQKWEVRC